jgi:uncharacterized protein (TIGR02117 family)
VSTPREAIPSRIPAANDVHSGDGTVTIYVTSNGWHSVIVVARASLPTGAIPEAADFPDAIYLSLGWGDAEYYPARRPTFGMMLGAALQPTPAVIHMAGLRAHPREAFPSDEVVEIKIPTHAFRNLVAYLDGTFARDGPQRAHSVAPGLYRFSLFYPAKGAFHLFNTCNTWTARGLAAAGWPIRVSGTVSAEDLMAQLR